MRDIVARRGLRKASRYSEANKSREQRKVDERRLVSSRPSNVALELFFGVHWKIPRRSLTRLHWRKGGALLCEFAKRNGGDQVKTPTVQGDGSRQGTVKAGKPVTTLKYRACQWPRMT
jgi:hypothetical protein